jgi:hypothetical protein
VRWALVAGLRDFLSRLVAGNPGKGSGEAEGLLSREGAHFLGCDRCMGNEGL